MEKLRQLIDAFFAHKRFNLFAGAIITVLVLIAYANTFTASFHFDDNPAIVENADIRHITLGNILKMLQSNRPVVSFSLLLNYQVHGLNVVGYHIFNIAVHIFNSYFLYLLIERTLSMPSLVQRYGGRARRIALFTVLLFAVHPIQTESVTYIISRSELLALFFYLATFLFFIKGTRREHGSLNYYLAAAFMALLAMMSKEWAATLPAMLALYDYFFLSDSRVKPVLARWYAYILVMLPWTYLYYSVSLFVPQSQNPAIGFNVTTALGINAQTYFLTSMNVIWTYIRLLILPINQNLDYAYPIAKTLFEFPTILSFVGHIVIFAGATWGYVKKKWTIIPFGVAWFYIGLSPTQSIVPIVDVIFEHRLYMPSIGFFLVAVVLYEQLFDWLEKRKHMA
ncbi:MAG: hypothetical protein OEW15_18820 [Nitrospirota bacterium]|nr:hypothetical protein [Nitrospirota bacterium]